MEYRSGIITLSVIAFIFAVMFYFSPEQTDFLNLTHARTADALTVSIPDLKGNLLGLIFLVAGVIVAMSGFVVVLIFARRGYNGPAGLVLALALGGAGTTLLAPRLPAMPSDPRVTSLLAYFDGIYVYTESDVRSRTRLCAEENARGKDCLEALAYMEDRATVLDLRAASIIVACLSLFGFLIGRTSFLRRPQPVSRRQQASG